MLDAGALAQVLSPRFHGSLCFTRVTYSDQSSSPSCLVEDGLTVLAYLGRRMFGREFTLNVTRQPSLRVTHARAIDWSGSFHVKAAA